MLIWSLSGIALAAVIGIIVIMSLRKDVPEQRTEGKKKVVSVKKETEKPKETPVPVMQPEEDIYSFLQGPKSWSRRLVWSGEWGESIYQGGSFGGFGCGLCCIANVYSSLTRYECTPVEAYRYARRHTDYAGGGAIAWGYMRRSLSGLGFECEVRKKPAAYEAFQQDIRKSKAAIVLVSSADSECYWKNTPGHYVTVFLYQEKEDKVFLADSGDPEHNRSWISLKKIYKSLKTASDWQYLVVKEYDGGRDNWKHKKAEGNWIRK